MSDSGKKQKKEIDEKTKERQKTILLIGLFFVIAIIFAISGVANILYDNRSIGIERIVAAVALVFLGIYYALRDRKKK